MFCRKCGNKNEDGAKFCKTCGEKFLDASAKRIDNVKESELTKKNTEPKKPIIDKDKMKKIGDNCKNILLAIKKHIIKFKWLLIGIVVAIALIILSFALYNNLHDFTKLSWDEKYGDYKVEVTGPSTISLKVKAYEKDDTIIKDIKYTVTDGKIVTDGNKVEWKLPNKDGKYKITAETPSGKKITKEVSVVILNEKGTLNGVVNIKNEKDDSDQDGLNDAEEKKLGTNYLLADSDNDGLSDYYEINVSKTEPLKADSDKDGLNDGDELDLALDPLNDISMNDGIKDGERKVKFNIDEPTLGISMELNGKGNIASTTIDTFKNNTFENMNGILNKVYEFYTNGTIESAIVKINYSLEEITAKGLNEDNLTLYYFNEKTKELEAMPTTVDKETKQVTVTLKHFSKYVLGDSELVNSKFDTQIMFVIDNSVSMYSEQQMIDAGYSNSTGAIGNDTEFKRLSLTNSMIDMFTGNYEFGVAEFAGNYVNLKEFTDNKKELKKSVDSMKSNWESNTTGTNIIDALESSIDEYENDSNQHYIILLTDGKNTKDSFYNKKNSIIESAKENDVKICVIGIGKELDTEYLESIAESTGCAYYNATDADALDEIYSRVGSSINYNYVDTDNDNEADGMVVADSGFLVKRDGFSFDNFFTTNSPNGNCYGMAAFAMLYYKDELPMELDDLTNKQVVLSELKIENNKADGYDLDNTYFDYGKNLYDYIPTTEGLNLYLNSKPSDYRDTIVKNVWTIKEEYKKSLEKIGAEIDEVKYTGKDKKQFKKYETALLDIESDTFSDNVTSEEKELFNAIWRLFITQAQDNRLSFSSEPDETYDKLLSDLKSGTPTILIINSNHAINATRLIQDNENANKFKIEVYDNNYPGESRYITGMRTKFSKVQFEYTSWTNEYQYEFEYDADNDGKQEKTDVDISSLVLE